MEHLDLNRTFRSKLLDGKLIVEPYSISFHSITKSDQLLNIWEPSKKADGKLLLHQTERQISISVHSIIINNKTKKLLVMGSKLLDIGS